MIDVILELYVCAVCMCVCVYMCGAGSSTVPNNIMAKWQQLKKKLSFFKPCFLNILKIKIKLLMANQN